MQSKILGDAEGVQLRPEFGERRRSPRILSVFFFKIGPRPHETSVRELPLAPPPSGAAGGAWDHERAHESAHERDIESAGARGGGNAALVARPALLLFDSSLTACCGGACLLA